MANEHDFVSEGFCWADFEVDEVFKDVGKGLAEDFLGYAGEAGVFTVNWYVALNLNVV